MSYFSSTSTCCADDREWLQLSNAITTPHIIVIKWPWVQPHDPISLDSSRTYTITQVHMYINTQIHPIPLWSGDPESNRRTQCPARISNQRSSDLVIQSKPIEIQTNLWSLMCICWGHFFNLQCNVCQTHAFYCDISHGIFSFILDLQSLIHWFQVPLDQGLLCKLSVEETKNRKLWTVRQRVAKRQSRSQGRRF